MTSAGRSPPNGLQPSARPAKSPISETKVTAGALSEACVPLRVVRQHVADADLTTHTLAVRDRLAVVTL